MLIIAAEKTTSMYYPANFSQCKAVMIRVILMRTSQDERGVYELLSMLGGYPLGE